MPLQPSDDWCYDAGKIWQLFDQSKWLYKACLEKLHYSLSNCLSGTKLSRLYLHEIFLLLELKFGIIQLHTSTSCHFKFVPPALDNFETLLYNKGKRVDLQSNFITAMVTISVESFSFIILAYTGTNGSSFAIGVSTWPQSYELKFNIAITVTIIIMQLQLNASEPRVLYESDGFDRRLISNEPVRKLQWQNESEVILYAITTNSVSW